MAVGVGSDQNFDIFTNGLEEGVNDSLMKPTDEVE